MINEDEVRAEFEAWSGHLDLCWDSWRDGYLAAAKRYAPQWIPVSEPPHSDELVVLIHPDWTPEVGQWKEGVTVGLVPTRATHWMPLPSPPEGETT